MITAPLRRGSLFPQKGIPKMKNHTWTETIVKAISNWVAQNCDEEWNNSQNCLSEKIFNRVNSCPEFWSEWEIDKPTSVEGFSKVLDRIGIYNIALEADDEI